MKLCLSMHPHERTFCVYWNVPRYLMDQREWFVDINLCLMSGQGEHGGSNDSSHIKEILFKVTQLQYYISRRRTLR